MAGSSRFAGLTWDRRSRGSRRRLVHERYTLAALRRRLLGGPALRPQVADFPARSHPDLPIPAGLQRLPDLSILRLLREESRDSRPQDLGARGTFDEYQRVQD